MKNNKFLRMFAMLWVLVLSMVCLAPNANASSQTPPVFLLECSNQSETLYVSGCYVTDGSGNYYFISISGVATLAQNGYQIKFVGTDVEANATCIGQQGSLSFFDVSGLDDVKPIAMSNSITTDAYVGYLQSEGSGLTLYKAPFSIDDQWVKEDTYLYSISLSAQDQSMWGAPVLNSNYEVVGLVSRTNDSKMAIVTLAGNIAGGNEGNPLVDNPDANNPGENGNGDDSTTDTQKTNAWSWFPFVMIGGAAVFGFYLKNKKDNDSGKQENDAYGAEGTIGLDPDMKPEPEFGAGTAPVAPVASASWQIRGVGGLMDGRVFRISGQLRLGRGGRSDVVFPQGTAGISGEHCQLSVVDGRVVLRDLQSSYGTYLAKRVKLEPHVDYHLQSGDEFTLAQGGQTFRLERTGETPSKSGPSVRDAAGNRTYHADSQGRLAFGRSERCQVRFRQTDAGVSGSHCVLYRDEKGLFLMDTGSSNGTFLKDGRRLKPNVPYRVQKGATFFLATPKYSFVITED